MTSNSSPEHNKIFLKGKNTAMRILFNPNQIEYNLFYSYNSEIPVSLPISRFSLKGEALANIKKLLEKIKFVGLSSLIDFCKNERVHYLQIVFEWINFFIYKEERKYFELYRPDENLILGISNFIETIESEKDEEFTTFNGFKFYSCEIRTILNKLILQIIINCDILYGTNEFESFINRLMLHIFTLNFEEASKNIKEVLSLKEKKIPFEIIPLLNIFQEVLQSTQNSKFINLNDTFDKIMSNLNNTKIAAGLKYLILFLQKKLDENLSEFFLDKEISLLFKLLYIIKHDSKTQLLHHLLMLEKHCIESTSLEGLVITGSSPKSITLIQNYINKTDDLLVSAILSKFFIDSKNKFHNQLENELDEALNKMKMFNERIQLNQKLNEIVSHFQKGLKSFTHTDKKTGLILQNNLELILNCFYCNAKIHADKADQFRNLFANNRDGNEYVRQN
jgi:hypothetical protein